MIERERQIGEEDMVGKMWTFKVSPGQVGPLETIFLFWRLQKRFFYSTTNKVGGGGPEVWWTREQLVRSEKKNVGWSVPGQEIKIVSLNLDSTLKRFFPTHFNPRFLALRQIRGEQESNREPWDSLPIWQRQRPPQPSLTPPILFIHVSFMNECPKGKKRKRQGRTFNNTTGEIFIIMNWCNLF